MNYELTDIEHDRIKDDIAEILQTKTPETFDEFKKLADHLPLDEYALREYWDTYVDSTYN